MLVLDNVTKKFNRVIAVDDLSFEVSEASVFGLLGPNGAGKTTTIRMIMSIIKPDSGVIKYRSEVFTKSSYKRIGYLPEERGLYQKMKLMETIVYLARLKNMSKKDAVSKANEYLDRFDLSPYSDKKIGELSKGNQQKVQFIISVIHSPHLLILDEPFAGLDPVNQLLLKEIITELQSQGTTIILSTHQMDQVEKMCKEICLINEGKKVLFGELRKIKKNYGVSTVLVEFDGDSKRLEDLNSLNWIQFEDNIMKGEIPKGSILNDILSDIMSRVSVRQFQLLEPSLEQIFIDQVKSEDAP